MTAYISRNSMCEKMQYGRNINIERIGLCWLYLSVFQFRVSMDTTLLPSNNFSLATATISSYFQMEIPKLLTYFTYLSSLSFLNMFVRACDCNKTYFDLIPAEKTLQ